MSLLGVMHTKCINIVRTLSIIVIITICCEHKILKCSMCVHISAMCDIKIDASCIFCIYWKTMAGTFVSNYYWFELCKWLLTMRNILAWIIKNYSPSLVLAIFSINHVIISTLHFRLLILHQKWPEEWDLLPISLV